MQTAHDPTPSDVKPVHDDSAVTIAGPLHDEMTVRNETDRDHQKVIQEKTNATSQLSLKNPFILLEENSQLNQTDISQVSSKKPDSNKSTRGRRRSRWKLKFHHQALPPEYLDHYESSIVQKDVSSCRSSDSRVQESKAFLQKCQTDIDACITIKLDKDSPDSNNSSNDISHSLLEKLCLPLPQKINVLNRSLNKQKLAERGKCNEDKHVSNKGLLGKLLLEKDKKNSEEFNKRSSVIMSSASNKNSLRTSAISNSQGNKVVKYQDLPYMGEITLDNMKPRRGRKPKKADICHLIYKNYGTVFSGGPNNQERETVSSLVSTAKVKSDSDMENNLRYKALETLKNTTINHIDVQNRIINSLLEKRLTAASQDLRKFCVVNSESFSSPKNVETTANVKQESSIDEPLNLCVKDLKQLKIRLLRKHGNYYEPKTDDSAKKTECSDLQKTEVGYDAILVQDNLVDDLLMQHDATRSSLGFQFSNQDIIPSNSSNSPLPGGYVYWPNAGVFVHPMALHSQLLYSQKMGSIPILPLSSSEASSNFPPPSPANLNLIPQNKFFNCALTKNLSTTSKPSKSFTNKPFVPKSFPVMVESGSKSSVMPSELTFPRMKRLVPSSNFPTIGTPAKRKRSAIFIPPMPTENNANPTTEVSICKFKFTGGAKPSLQEKKMLSVDSGGNFRYYSGTGDKSMRGYEFFPRESLQQIGNNVESSSEVFLTASALGNGDKLPSQNTLKDIGKSSRFETVTSKSPASQSLQQSIEFEESTTKCPYQQSSNSRLGLELMPKPETFNTQHFGNPEEEIGSKFRLRRKRKTRKSLVREKLEKTFKEKGFLIQTQQLESAEGATYCKFRQLRKFTRYLFRSWKDYLPGNVRDMSVAAGVGNYQDSEQEEQTCSSPLTPCSWPAGDDHHLTESPQSNEHTILNNKHNN